MSDSKGGGSGARDEKDQSTDVYNTPLTRQLVLLGLFAVLLVVGLFTVVLPGLEEGDEESEESSGLAATGSSASDPAD